MLFREDRFGGSRPIQAAAQRANEKARRQNGRLRKTHEESSSGHEHACQTGFGRYKVMLYVNFNHKERGARGRGGGERSVKPILIGLALPPPWRTISF